MTHRGLYRYRAGSPQRYGCLYAEWLRVTGSTRYWRDYRGHEDQVRDRRTDVLWV